MSGLGDIWIDATDAHDAASRLDDLARSNARRGHLWTAHMRRRAKAHAAAHCSRVGIFWLQVIAEILAAANRAEPPR